jgi:hypothetical protein
MWVKMVQKRVILCQSKKRKGKFVPGRVILCQMELFLEILIFIIMNDVGGDGNIIDGFCVFPDGR